MSEPRARLIVQALPQPGTRLRLTGSEASHARARRVRAGDRVVLVDGSGGEATGRVVASTPSGLELEVEMQRPGRSGERVDLTLLVAAVRPERLSWIVEKATELGVGEVVLVRSQRTQGFRGTDAVRARLERVARAAAKQSQSDRWPRVTGPVTFEDAVTREHSGERFVLDLGGEDFPPRLETRHAMVLVGPEGGWTPAEVEIAKRAGWRVTRLPAGKLRTETAAIAALVLLRAAMAGGRS